ncbi:hypothetical protein Tcan_13898, partial [Toxocara canis]
PIILCDIYTFIAIAVLLLANSFDRYLVVSIPLKYYVLSKTIVLWELIVFHILAFSVFISTIIVSAGHKENTATAECRQSAYLPENVYTALSCMRACFSTSSILVMGVVLCKLRCRHKERQAFTSDNKLAAFTTGQHSFTRLMIGSCIVTLALDVIPSSISAYAHLWQLPGVDNYTTYSRFASYLNAMNMILVTSIGQKEIREEMAKKLHIFCGVFRCSKRSRTIHAISFVESYAR